MRSLSRLAPPAAAFLILVACVLAPSDTATCAIATTERAAC
jgi:hypothetical protein